MSIFKDETGVKLIIIIIIKWPMTYFFANNFWMVRD